MVKIYQLSTMTSEDLLLLKRRAETNIEDVLDMTREMIDRVRLHGNVAVVEYIKKFDYANADAESLKVSEQEFALARETLAPEIKRAITQAHSNIKQFHQRQVPEEMWFVELEEGVFAGEKITPVASAGLYVPRGKGSFPSVMLMLAVPAIVAGVSKVIVCTPPDEAGEVDAASLFAAETCGIKEIYKIGGIQAIAAVALGTETIPKVDKIIGPGNVYVSAAKRLLYGTVDVGPPAGPSEAIILADEYTDPRLAALDLLNEAEHGPDSAALLVTHSESVAAEAAKIIPEYVQSLPEWRRNFCEKVLSSYGGILLTSSLEESIDFINDYAPEHLEILVKEPFSILGKIKNAGEILLGPYTPIAIANYCLGLNAILPTGGFAKSYSAVSVFDFLKRSGVGYLTKDGFERLKETTWRLADYEGFPAHAMAVRERDNLLED